MNCLLLVLCHGVVIIFSRRSCLVGHFVGDSSSQGSLHMPLVDSMFSFFTLVVTMLSTL